MNLVDIYFQLKGDVQYIERELEQAIDAKTRELYLSSTHLLKAGGKRIRPVFVLLAGNEIEARRRCLRANSYGDSCS